MKEHDKIHARRLQVALARLLNLCEEKDAEIRNDPVKLLHQASKEILSLRLVIEMAKNELLGLSRLSMSGSLEPTDIGRESYERNRRALAILDRIKGPH